MLLKISVDSRPARVNDESLSRFLYLMCVTNDNNNVKAYQILRRPRRVTEITSTGSINLNI
jgi:hypothetical protein